MRCKDTCDFVCRVEEDGVLQGDAVLPEEERAGRETVHDDQACAGADGTVGGMIDVWFNDSEGGDRA